MDEQEGKLETIDKVFRNDPNDDRPLGGGGKKFQIPEYADGENPPVVEPPKKKPTNSNRLATKNKPVVSEEQQQQQIEQDGNQQQQNSDQNEEKAEDGFVKIDKPIRNDPNDERPLGGGKKFQIPEFADGEQPPQEDKPKPKAIPKRLQARLENKDKNVQENQDDSQQDDKKPSASSTAADKPWLKKKGAASGKSEESSLQNNEIDEKPIGGKTNLKNQDDETPTPSGNSNDERPIGGGSKKNTFSQDQEYPDNERPLGNNKQQNNQDDERPIGGNKKNNTFNPDDERPIGGPKKNNFIDEDERPIGGGNKNSLADEDERPIGAGNKSNMMSEYPDGMDAESMQGASSSKDEGPLSKRLVSKVLKTRQSAFQELAQEFETKKKDASLFSEYESEWDKKISDINPSVQEQACNALKNWIVFNPNFKNLKINDTSSILKALIEKCIASGKPQLLPISKEVLCLLYEKNNDQGEFFEALNTCVKNKNAKVVCAGIQSITDLMSNFGVKKFDFMKPFFGEIEKQSLSTNSQIRADCMVFFKEAMKWLGDAIVKNYTKNLKKLQQDELDKFYSEWDKQPMVPLRASEEEKKAAQNKASSSGATGGAGGASSSAGGDIDLYDIVDAVDIFVKYSDKWCDKVLALTKWQEKKEHLDEIITAASQPKVSPGNYMPVVGMIKRLLNDNNSNVQLNSIKLTGCLCKSIRKGFNMGAKQLFDQIIIKFRDKKTLIIEETKSAIDNFWYSVTLEEVIEEVKEALQDKAPPMKMQVMQAIERYFDTRPNASKSRDAFKQACIPTIKKLFDDSTSEIREYSLKLIGKFNKQKDWFTSEEINNLTAGLNDQKKAKIQQGQENNDKPDLGASKIIQKPGTASKPPIKQQEEDEEVKENKSTLNSTIRGGGTKKVGGEKTQTEKQQNQSSGGGGASMNDEDVSSSSIPSSEECEQRLKDNGMPEEYSKIFAGTKNPEKVEALQTMASSSYIESCLLELLVYLDKVAFKSSILVVQKEVLNLVENAINLDSFNKKCFHVITDFIIKYVGEAKFNAQVQSIIEKSCEKLVPKYVISRLIRVLKQDEKKMSPKSAQELSKSIVKIIDLATLKYINFMDVLQFGKESIQNTNPSIKAGGQEILKKLYEHMGETLTNNFLKDIPANIMGTLTKEFSKLTVLSESDKASNATMKFVGEAAKEVTASAKSASSNPLDQLPRADISKDAEKVLKKLSDAKWQTRKEGLDELDKLLQKSNNRIQLTGLFDLLAALKQTLQESNKGVQRQAFNFIGRFAEACGKDLRPHSKNLLCQIVSNLSNKESLMRKEVIQALDRFEKAIGGEHVVNVMSAYLSENNPELRQGIIEWILRHPESYAAGDLNAYVQPILLCLDDKSKEIRVLAEQLLEKTISVTTAEPFKFAFKDMKPATVKAIQPIISKYTNLDDDGDQAPTPAVTRKDNKSSTQIIQKPNDKNPPKIIVAGQKPGTAQNSQTGKEKTLTRNATTMNLKANDEKSDTASNNGDKTPTKSKFGLNHSASTNKINIKPDNAQNAGKSSFQQGSQQSSQTQIEDFTMDKIQQQSVSSMQTSQFSTSNRLSSMVDQTAKKIMIDDSMIFPVSNSISSLKNKRFNFPLYQNFNIQNPSNEHFEFIQNELKFLLSSTVTPLMFSFNYKCVIEATEQIKNACHELMQQPSLKYLSDLLFQWCFMRLYGNFNIEVSIHLLDTIRTILHVLQKSSETLSDLEIGTINASIRECFINLPETSSVLQQVNIITNLQLKMLGEKKDKVIHFWLNQLLVSVGDLHPQYFESDNLNLEVVQNGYQNKLYDLITNVLIKNINSQKSLEFLNTIQFKTPKAINFILAVQEQFGRDALLQAGFTSSVLDQYEQNKQVPNNMQSPGFPNPQQFNVSIYNNVSNQQKLITPPTIASSNPSSQIANENVTPKNKNSVSALQANGVKLNETPSFNKTQQGPSLSNQQTNQTQQPSTSLQKPQQAQQQIQQAQQAQQQIQQPSLEEIFISKVKSLQKDPYSNEKIDMLVYINNIIQDHENQAYLSLIESNTNLLLDMIYTQLRFVFENKKTISPQYLQYFLNVMYKCFTIKSFAKGCQFDHLKNFTEEILYRLLAEDENQNKEEQNQNNASGVIKLINSTMLRILENSRPEQIYKILLELLIKYRQQFNYAKILGLIIKCILKVTKGLEDFINQIDLNELLLYFHKYICEFLVPNPTMSDDIGVKTIKTILKELCKLKGEAIWVVYNNSIKNCPQKDQFIFEWIGLVLKPTQSSNTTGNPISIVSPRDLRFERKISATQHSLTNISPDQIDSLIIKTIQSIKQSDTFEQGIAQLHEILTKYPSINIETYLQDCTQNFTKFVINNLEKYDQQKKVSGLAGIQNNSQLFSTSKNYQQPNYNDDSRSEDKNSSSYGIGKQMDYESLHNRINEFKQRIIRRDQQQYNELESISQINYQSQQGDKSYQPKTTEEYMQKVIDMKAKRHNQQLSQGNIKGINEDDQANSSFSSNKQNF
ncbi:hypothetical protein ABPG74_001203 [Tetrahymena malaccensis]